MAFTEIELKWIDQYIGVRFKNRVPLENQDRLRNEIRIEGNNIFIAESRPRWDKPDEWLPLDFAKLRYVRSRNIWKLYWKRASGKWEIYGPKGEAGNLKELADVIDEDRYGCFFG
ncbi:MAG: DUF3024 domain-containing protein [Desulfosudaceae bacterium]